MQKRERKRKISKTAAKEGKKRGKISKTDAKEGEKNRKD